MFALSALRFGRRALAITAIIALAGCGNGKKAPPLTTLFPTTTTTTAPTVIYAPTKLTVAGYAAGVDQAPFYPQIVVTAVTCGAAGSGRSVTALLPGGGAGGGSLSVPTTLVLEPGKAEVRDHTGRALYREAKSTIAPSDHGSVVLSMTAVASADADRRHVAYGALDVSGSYLCP